MPGSEVELSHASTVVVAIMFIKKMLPKQRMKKPF
jgi:hypothetical protein